MKWQSFLHVLSAIGNRSTSFWVEQSFLCSAIGKGASNSNTNNQMLGLTRSGVLQHLNSRSEETKSVHQYNVHAKHYIDICDTHVYVKCYPSQVELQSWLPSATSNTRWDYINMDLCVCLILGLISFLTIWVQAL